MGIQNGAPAEAGNEAWRGTEERMLWVYGKVWMDNKFRKAMDDQNCPEEVDLALIDAGHVFETCGIRSEESTRSRRLAHSLTFFQSGLRAGTIAEEKWMALDAALTNLLAAYDTSREQTWAAWIGRVIGRIRTTMRNAWNGHDEKVEIESGK